jgi:hypothetical protein
MKAIRIRKSRIFSWACGLILVLGALVLQNLVACPIMNCFPQHTQYKKYLLFICCSWNYFYWFSSKFLDIYPINPKYGTYKLYILNCRQFNKVCDVHILKLCSIFSNFVFSCFFISLYKNPNASNSEQWCHRVNSINHDFFKKN